LGIVSERASGNLAVNVVEGDEVEDHCDDEEVRACPERADLTYQEKRCKPDLNGNSADYQPFDSSNERFGVKVLPLVMPKRVAIKPPVVSHPAQPSHQIRFFSRCTKNLRQNSRAGDSYAGSCSPFNLVCRFDVPLGL
jgi:hypothetical protein